ncbi:MAG: 23S rRNA (guanosine(2251)-2'-O)-methyltransferase RlmB [Gammaproteobacteria bacterium]|nr:23S rRNA (guanosine(2251)-2'-O)-methyltransferase RlmB [Gammaproteobacteria bacterium]|tara:strand:- start:3654 stop:4457 length:804 start_codon:yes stop_codon:yes gene_type:complete
MSAREWIVGIHAVSELLRRHPEDVHELLLQQERSDQRIDEVRELAKELGLVFKVVPRAELEKRIAGDSKSSGKSGADRRQGKTGPVHQGVAALCQWRDTVKDEAFLTALLDKLPHPPLLLILDEVTDPHNLGACLRTADAAGVDAVIVPKDNSATLNLTVRKVASGAAEKVNLVAVTNLSRTMAALQQRGIWISGAAGEATQSLYEADLTGPRAIAMGSEGKGLRRLTREHCDFLISIPMAGAVSSLNVSVATGVFLFEAIRQRSGN